MPTHSLSGPDILERHFLEVRHMLIEIGATFDRIDRAADAARARQDPRRAKLDEALGILLADQDNRAERLQLLFSRGYDPNWMTDFAPAERLARQSQ